MEMVKLAFTLPSDDEFDPNLRRAFEFADQSVDPALVDHQKVKIRKDSILMSGDSTFYTLQGEGPTVGYPCVFARLHVCNLACTWCDAFYTWNPKTPEFWTESTRHTFEEAAALIKDKWPGYYGNQHLSTGGHRPRVIWTGGEPLAQRYQIDNVMRILDKAYERSFQGWWDMEIETNGTIMPTTLQLAKAQFNVSPKLRNSENREGSMVKPKILAALNKANSTFKFVCWEESDLDEIVELYEPHIDNKKIIIMPQGIYTDEIDANLRKLYEPCMERGYRLQGRLQSQFADGARRGV